MQATVILVVEDEWVLRNALMQALRAARLESAGRWQWRSGDRPSARFSEADRRAVYCHQLNGFLTGWDVADAVRESTRPRIVYAAGNNVARSRQISGSAFLEIPYRVPDVVAAFACLDRTRWSRNNNAR